MIIYLDSDYKCHVDNADGLTAVETNAFDGKCKTYIEGYRFVPHGSVWVREDGALFHGEMIAAWIDPATLNAAQRGYEESIAEMQDMTDALNLLGVVVDG